MAVVRLRLAYDGTGFRGWARQRDQRTVEGVLSDALARVLGSAPKLSVAGRTDAGVHARGQVASFRWPDEVDAARLQRALNAMVAPEVVVTVSDLVPERFDARFSATAREYRFRIHLGPWPDPFEARYVWHRPGDLSLPRMRAAAHHLVGEHDFAAYCRRPPNDASTVRRLDRLAVTRTGERVEITARANSFLHQMVRSLVGTLVRAGEGALDPDSVPEVLASGDRGRAGPVAPPHGLTLERVIYGRRTKST
ncbi:MAG TPA: tRNA pseudouridine(38-40) synthase TruA [Actinomycetota bacterium]